MLPVLLPPDCCRPPLLAAPRSAAAHTPPCLHRLQVNLKYLKKSARDEARAAFKQQAKGAYQVCLGYSVKYQYFDDYSRKCEEWLAQNYKAEFHLVDEFRGAPNKVNNPLDEQAYPVRIGGEPLVTAPPTAADDKKAGQPAPSTK